MTTLMSLTIGFGLLFIISICKAARECARINEGDYPPAPPVRRIRRVPLRRMLKLNPGLLV